MGRHSGGPNQKQAEDCCPENRLTSTETLIFRRVGAGERAGEDTPIKTTWDPRRPQSVLSGAKK